MKPHQSETCKLLGKSCGGFIGHGEQRRQEPTCLGELGRSLVIFRNLRENVVRSDQYRLC
jgi:hypothetical protein